MSNDQKSPLMTEDEGLEGLFDEKALSARRRAAEKKYRDFSSDQIRMLRRRCKNDLFFLCAGPLEYDLLSPRLHGHLCGWLTKTRDAQHRMTLLPRDHYKSTVVTIAESVQMALPNVDNVVSSHPYALGTNIKLLIGHEVKESAARFLYEIAAAFTRKELMLALFPECIPNRREHRINKFELELPRTQHHKEPTFDTIGAGGAAQGRHYNWIKLDDLVGEDARDSETVMGRTLTWFDNVNSLLTRLKFDGWDLIGTRWAYRDIYSHAMDRYGIHEPGSVLNCIPERDIESFGGGLLRIYGRGAIEGGEPIFPEEFPLETLKVLRKNKLVWASQYANNPMESGLNEFSWPLKFYNVDGRGDLVVFSGTASYKVAARDLDICILLDPSMGESTSADESGIVVTGTDSNFNIFLLETIKRRLKPPELVDELIRLYMKYYPRAISIEEVAFSAIYKYWLQEKSEKMGIYLPIRSYKPPTRKSKHARIRGLSNFFASGQVYVAEGMHDFRDEYERFPMGDSEHLLDALAQGPEIWTPGLQSKDVEHYREAEEAILDERSALTGY